MNTELLLDTPEGSLRLPWNEGWAGRRVSEILIEAGLNLNTRCGGKGWCQGCEVELVAGTLEGPEGPLSGPAMLRSCLCRMPAEGPLHMRLHPRALIPRAASVADTFAVDVMFELRPPVTVVPGVADTAFAADIGTTTVALVLVDLVTGQVLSRAGAFNAQIRYGDNVLTRIESAGRPGHLQAMQRAVVQETLVPLLRVAAERAGRTLDRVCHGAIAGNTTMLHLLTGTDPTSIGTAPFVPEFLGLLELEAGTLGLSHAGEGKGAKPCEGLKHQTTVCLLPGYSAYVGADLACGVWSTGMLYEEAPTLLVDIGTNGEMVLSLNGLLYGCATAAGPAFEGAGLSSGTRAHEGAVWKVTLKEPGRLEGGFALEVLGAVEPGKAAGLCGSAYLDFLAVARASGLLLATGRYDREKLKHLPEEWVVRNDQGLALCLAPDTALLVSEQDIASLLQAKAAVAAGLSVLLAAAGVSPGDISCLYLAGGFGLHLNLDHALALGFFPGFEKSQIRVVGNSSLAGAVMAVTDRRVGAGMAETARRARIVELNAHPEFEDRFIDSLCLP